MKKLLVFMLLLSFWACVDDNPMDDPVGDPDPLEEQIIINEPYGSDPLQKMDVYLPAGRDTDTKVIVVIHGGSWSGGDKTDMTAISDSIRAKWPEVAVANINYRLANGSSILYPELDADIRSAILHIVDKKDEWVVSDKLGLAGASAGAHLAMRYTYQFDQENYIQAVSDIFGPANFLDADWYEWKIFFIVPVKDVLKNYVGSYWNEDLYKQMSPYHMVNSSNFEPTIIFHGTYDFIVPFNHSVTLHEKFDTLGLTNEFIYYEGDGHGFNPQNTNDCINKSIEFFKDNME